MSYDDRHDDRYRGTRGAPPHAARYDDDYDDRYDDGAYDEYDEIDDEYPEPGRPASHVGDAETLLRRAVDIIANAPTMPLSSSPRIDRDEIIELLHEALARLPEELRQARWMLKERQDFVNKTRREANEMLEAARVQAERMVQRTEVVRAAEQRARHVVDTAENDARRLKLETEDFLDQRLASFEILLDKLGKTVAAGRQKLSIGSAADAPLPVDTDDQDDPTKGFFDQDR
jgi:F0F1-type ATP synthase membrane subunit b/b'